MAVLSMLLLLLDTCMYYLDMATYACPQCRSCAWGAWILASLSADRFPPKVLSRTISTYTSPTKSYKYTQFKYEKEEPFSHSKWGVLYKTTKSYWVTKEEISFHIFIEFKSIMLRGWRPRFLAFSSLLLCVGGFGRALHCAALLAGFWFVCCC